MNINQIQLIVIILFYLVYANSEDHFYYYFDKKIYLNKKENEYAILFADGVGPNIKKSVIQSNGT